MAVTLRRPQPAEVPQLSAMYREGRIASELEYAPEYIATRLDEETYFNRIWHSVLDGTDTYRAQVLWDDTRPVGFVRVGAMVKYRDVYNVDLQVPAATGEIHQLYVLPGIIGRGYGLTLLRAGLIDLKEMGFTGLVGCTYRKNMRIRDFIIDLGGHHLLDTELVVNDTSGVQAPHTSIVSFYYAELPDSLPGALARMALEKSQPADK